MTDLLEPVPALDVGAGHRLVPGVRRRDELSPEQLGEQLLRSASDPRALVAAVRVPELTTLHEELPQPVWDSIRHRVVTELLRDVDADVTLAWQDPELMLVHVPGDRARSAEDLTRRLEEASRGLAAAGLPSGDGQLYLSPHTGVASNASSRPGFSALDQALDAALQAQGHMDLVPRMTGAGSRGPAHRARRTPLLLRGPGLVVCSYLLALGVPFVVYELLYLGGLDVTRVAYLIAVGAGLLTAWLAFSEVVRALPHHDPPPPPVGTPVPAASAIIAAYLPNEADTIEETVQRFLGLDHPGDLQVILAYNTPRPLPVETRLREVARRDPRLLLLAVDGSTSKAQNVNAALAHVTGDVVGVFDADHHPRPGAFERAWRWVGNDYDVVQGHCVVRNGEESRLAAMVAVEFESMYAVSHPGRARWHGFGIFGGSNGYWRASALRAMRFRRDMLTEDIDASMRGLALGLRIASDPYLVSTELAPTSFSALWRQRLRWAQGWHQVGRVRMRPALRSARLTVRQKVGVLVLLGWTQVVPWISLQPLALAAVALLNTHHSRQWFAPLVVLTFLMTLSESLLQGAVAWLLAEPSIKRRPLWWLQYLLFNIVFYAEYKNAGVRTAHLREVVGEEQWVVTPRTAAAVAALDGRSAPAGAVS
ncbi:glycosyltransferase family 2 protein [Luteipulveratus sp. YIM 133132]|uniref:glycosyltransferase family 2 protein n=1 Tax=Luteipulveratus flavus TaxID=3031728 RepID=UPI0023AF77EF|nr:glycosyltransferase family 2 protein [Luteipulveratus sp. YIM 133132]MDE9367462.1 glycosyltransferase family 2 protein [Luteipulveratus sp. YIM 133132]